ncbi:hypothetical protein ACFQVB_41730 [Paraburkholderia humisilvae]|uniref:hypothetical protein n=1 Tax=Paraburkholderia humisilvae TaxID=627669 RepID=UPI003622C0ED
MAAGAISASSTDAINGSELYSVASGLSSSIADAKPHYVSINDGTCATSSACAIWSK